MGNITQQMKDKVNDKDVKRMIAIIQSMTKKERRHPDLLNGSRKVRVAKGAGMLPQDVNKLLKQFQQMEKMMSKLGSGGMRGLMRQMGGMLKPGGGGFPR
jgi:signal recognition particle subunit SRP54